MSNVQSLIDAAAQRTTTLASSAASALEAANSAINGIPRTVTLFTGITKPTYTAPPALGTFPSLPLISFIPGTAPTITPVIAIPAADAGTAPLLNATPEAYVPPTKPNQLAQFAVTPPTVNTSLQFPSAPELIVPVAPTLATHDVPVAPQVSLPAFSATVPLDTSAAPVNLDAQLTNQQARASTTFVQAIRGYVSEMMADKFPNYAAQADAMRAQLEKYFAGGTALSTEVEQKIYDRARAKNDLEAARVQNAAFVDFAARGFSMPPGALSSTIALARRDAANANSRAAADIAIAQAEMEQKNLQFAVTTSASLQKVAVDAMLAYMQNLMTINGQTIQYAQAVVSSLIEVYNSQVKMFSSRLEAYRAQAAVYETQLKGAMAGIELYRVQIDALQAMTQVDRTAVDVFRARIEVLSSQSTLYRNQIEAVQAQAGLEKLKIELFQGQVQAYSTQVQAKNAEYQGYTAQIEGEVSKVKIFAAKVEAYGAQVQGYKATIDAKLAAVQAASATNQAIGQTNQSALLGYKASVEAQGEVARTQIAIGQSAIQAYEASAHAGIAQASASAEYYKAATTVALGEAQLSVTTAMESAKIALATGTAVANVATGNAKIYGQLAGAAMAGMNTLASETTTV